MSFHVRRKDREITDASEIRKVLKATKYVTVAFCMNNEPYLVSLSHGFDAQHTCIYFHCASEGKKLVYAQANNRVWGQTVLDYDATDECDSAYTSVHFSGIIVFLTDPKEKWHALKILVRQTSNTPEEKLAKVKPEKLLKTTIGRIDITYMTGKRHEISPTR